MAPGETVKTDVGLAIPVCKLPSASRRSPFVQMNPFRSHLEV